MADDDLQPRKAVEYAAEDEADDVDRGFDVPGQPGPENISLTIGENPLNEASMTGCGGRVGCR